MNKLIIILIIILLTCKGLIIKNNQTETPPESPQELFRTFNDAKCSNPCWLGIEVGITDKATTITTLKEHGIEFSLEGYDGDSIWLHDIPEGLFPSVALGKFTRGGIDFIDGTVFAISFNIDLCVSTVIAAYGVPKIWSFANAMIYYENNTIFRINKFTLRVIDVVLHRRESMPDPSELENWSDYSNLLPEKCLDVFTT